MTAIATIRFLTWCVATFSLARGLEDAYFLQARRVGPNPGRYSIVIGRGSHRAGFVVHFHRRVAFFVLAIAYLFANISSKFSSTLPTMVHAAISGACVPAGSGPIGSVAICVADFGFFAYSVCAFA